MLNQVTPSTSEILNAMRHWLATNYPEALYASLVVRLGDELPAVVLPVVQKK